MADTKFDTLEDLRSTYQFSPRKTISSMQIIIWDRFILTITEKPLTGHGR
jgi:hypothetical protein